MSCRYPEITVRLVGTDGNAFAILGKVRSALKANHVPAERLEQFQTEATGGDYYRLLAVVQDWVNVR